MGRFVRLARVILHPVVVTWACYYQGVLGLIRGGTSFESFQTASPRASPPPQLAALYAARAATSGWRRKRRAEAPPVADSKRILEAEELIASFRLVTSTRSSTKSATCPW